MDTCENCELGFQERDVGSKQSICNSCKRLEQGVPQIRVHPISREDLELILAWRSHPEIYRHFRNQTEPLTWSEHLSWFESRDSTRHDFLIHYGGRRVGVVGLSANDEITIYIGEFSARGKGIATDAVNWLKNRFKSRIPLTAEVYEDNKSSKNLFRSCGFCVDSRCKGWVKFIYNA